MSRGLEVYLGGLKKMLAGVTTTYQTPSLVLQYLVFLGVEVKVEWTREEKVLSRQKKPWQLQNAASALFSATVPGSDAFYSQMLTMGSTVPVLLTASPTLSSRSKACQAGTASMR